MIQPKQIEEVYFITEENSTYLVKKGYLKQVLSGNEVKYEINWQGYDYLIPENWIFETSLEALVMINELNYQKQLNKAEEQQQEVIRNQD